MILLVQPRQLPSRAGGKPHHYSGLFGTNLLMCWVTSYIHLDGSQITQYALQRADQLDRHSVGW